jgi:hypothetical protein
LADKQAVSCGRIMAIILHNIFFIAESRLGNYNFGRSAIISKFLLFEIVATLDKK